MRYEYIESTYKIRIIRCKTVTRHIYHTVTRKYAISYFPTQNSLQLNKIYSTILFSPQLQREKNGIFFYHSIWNFNISQLSL